MISVLSELAEPWPLAVVLAWRQQPQLAVVGRFVHWQCYGMLVSAAGGLEGCHENLTKSSIFGRTEVLSSVMLVRKS